MADKTYEDFLYELGLKESSGVYYTENSAGYLGKYQMGEGALIDAGYVIDDGNYKDNNYSGGWTGKDNIFSKEDFLNEALAQESAVREYHQQNFDTINRLGLDEYFGQEINGLTITPSGMLAGAHLVGPGELKKFLESNGSYVPTDQNGTPITNYLDDLSGFPSPYTAIPIPSPKPIGLPIADSPEDLNNIFPEAGETEPVYGPIPEDRPIGDKAQDAADQFGNAEQQASPLVLDLDGDGIELTSLTSGGAVYWDLDQDGMAEATGWVSPDDGLLAYDRDSDGIISDHSELFGTEADDGFDILAGFDSNNDGVINSSDADFADLLIWQDVNNDGFSQSSELHTLADLDIASINLNYTSTDYQLAGNTVRSVSSYTKTDSSTHDIVDAWFTYDNMNTVYAGDVAMDVRTLFLPTVRGYGNMPDLHIAMSLDEGLLDMVEAVALADVSDLLDPTFDIGGKVKAIMHRWAGVEGEPWRGYGFDGEDLAFIEQMVDDTFSQRGMTKPLEQATQMLINAIETIYGDVLTKLLVQGAGAELFSEVAAYNPLTDSYNGTFVLDFTAIDAAFTTAALTGSDLESAWANVVRIINNTIGLDQLSSGDMASLETVIADSDPAETLTYETVLNSIYPDTAIDFFIGSSGDDSMVGTPIDEFMRAFGGNDTIDGNGGNDHIMAEDGNDTIYGGAGHDLIEAGEGNDYIAGGSGDDTLFGGYGDDMYFYESGLDVIRETAGYDTILFDESITSSQVTIEYAEENDSDLHILVDGQPAINIENYFSVLGGGVEYLSFADGTIIPLGDITQLSPGDNGNNTLTGADNSLFPDDTLEGYGGNDTLDGGAGDDILIGGQGDDTYYVGDGNDHIIDEAGDDTIVFGTGLDSTDVSYSSVNGTDLTVFFNGVEYAVIENQLNSLGTIETFTFDNSISVDTSTISLSQSGSSGADIIYGYQYGVSEDNVINAGAGNDRIYAYEGDDEIFGEDGNDDIYAGAGNDTLDGGTGDDYLSGGLGNDTYVVESGHDTISDSAGTDKIIFGSAYNPLDMTLGRSGVDGNDLDIYFDGILSATIAKHFSSLGAIETLEFSDTSTFSLSSYQNVTGDSGNNTLNGINDSYFTADKILGLAGADTLNGGAGEDALYGGDGNDTLNGGNDDDIVYGEAGDDTLSGDGGNDLLIGGLGEDTYIYTTAGDIIRDNGAENEVDTISFGSGIVAGDITLERVGNYDLQIKVSGNDAILIENQFTRNGQIETLAFDNSTTLDLASQSFTQTGTSASESLYGTNTSASDILEGLAGNDYLVGYDGDDVLDGGVGEDTLYGGLGDDTYEITDAGDTVIEEGGTDKIVFDSNFDPNDISLSRSGLDDLVISFDSVETLTVKNHFTDGGEIETLEFSDSSTLNLSTQSYVVNGDANDNTLHGISYGGDIDDVISGNGGHDTLYGYNGDDTLDGGAGNDIMYGGDGNDEYHSGEGIDIISDSGGTDTVYMASGLNAVDMTYERSGLFDVDILFSGQKVLTLKNQLKAASAVETLTYADSSTFDLTNITFATTGTSGADSIYGSNTVLDEIYGLDGNDTIYGYSSEDTLEGGLGNDYIHGGEDDDAYIWSVGDGDDFLYEDGGNDTLVLHGVNAEDIRFEHNATYDQLKINIGSEVITVSQHFKSDADNNNAYDIKQIEKIVLDDGSEIDLLNDLTFTGTSSGEYIYGLQLQGTTFEGLEGDDHLYGYTQDDTYEWSVGDGNDTIHETGGVDKLLLHGASAEDIRFENNSTYDHLKIHIGSETITVVQHFKSDADNNSAYDGLRLEKIILDDATEIDLLNDLTFTGTSSTDTIYGLQLQGTTFEGLEGTDYLHGNVSDDTYVWTLGDGNDTIYEDGGSDVLRLKDVAFDDIRLEKAAYDHLKIHIGSETITVVQHFKSDSQNNNGYDYLQVEKIVLDDGKEIDLINNVNFKGTDAGESLYGFQHTGTVLEGLEGNDYLTGYSENDSFVWALGDGNDVIYENGGSDQLVLHGVNESHIRLTQDTPYNHLKVHIGSETISINQHFKADANNDVAYNTTQVEKIVLDDGTEIDLLNNLTFEGDASNDSLYGLQLQDTILIGNAGSDSLYGYDANDTLIGGDGYDYLSGGQGANTYVFEAASAFNDVDSILGFNLSQGDAIEITDILNGYYNPSSDNITDFVQIIDSGSDSLLQIDQNGGADNFNTIATIKNITGLTDEQSLLDSGHLIFLESGNTSPLAVNDDVSVNEDQTLMGNVLSDNGSGADSDADSHALAVQVATVTSIQGVSVSIAANGDFSYTPPADFFGEDSFQYILLDGHGGRDIGTATITVNAVNDDPIANNDAFVGVQDDDIIGNLFSDNGNGADSDVENDTLTAQNGTYSTTQGGSVVIEADGDFTYTPSTSFTGSDSFTYTLYDGNGGSDTGTVNLTVNSASYNYVTGTSSADTLYGTSGLDVIEGLQANDYLYGYGGSDTYIWNTGDGYDRIYDSAGSNDTLSLGTGIVSDDVRLWNPNNGNLEIYIGSTRITVNDHFDGTGEELETILFSDSSTYDLTSDYTFTGTTSSDTIYGLSGEDDTLVGLSGNDYLYGYTGNDTYVWNTGDGYDRIYDSAGNDTLSLGTGITSGDLRFWNPNNGDLEIYIGSTRITVNDHFDGTGEELETILFSDTSTYDLSSDYTFTGTTSSDTIYGLSGEDDTLVGLSGNDYLYGYTGNDTYVWNTGDGYDRIYDSAGNDTLSLGAGISSGDLRFWSPNNGDLEIYIGSTRITVNDHFDGTGEELETILFSDTSTLDLTSVIEFTGTSSADYMYGTSNADILYSLAANDTVYAGSGDDIIHGGAGSDNLYGEAGNDTASFEESVGAVAVDLSAGSAVGEGNDTLNSIENAIGSDYGDTFTGDTGVNVFTGGSGADTFILDDLTAVDVITDFDTSEDDALDLSDILSVYDPMTDVLTDFVEITTSGSDSIVKVDIDGTGSTYAMTQIATLEDITGLTDEAALVAAGNLII